MSTSRPKFLASLTFRGFAMNPAAVACQLEAVGAEFGEAGKSRKLGAKPLARSFVRWEIAFSDSARLDEMIPTLISRVGGVERIAAVREQVDPEFVEVDLALWVKNSEEQEGGFIERETLASLVKMGATLSIGIYSRE